MKVDILNVVLWIVQVVLAGMFVMAGMMKTFQYEKAKAALPWVKEYSKGFVTFVGLVDLLGGLGVVLPALTGVMTSLTPLAALGIAVLMVVAAVFHARRGENQAIGLNVGLLVLAAFVAYGRWFLRPF